MSPKVSVVIPVYEVEDYLRRCVDSVISQTLQDIEIILVDDGSPDRSPEICDEYTHCDERIKVIHKTNGGLASARNAGMKIADGRYLFFVDSDDWLEPNGLEILYTIAEEQSVDFVRYRAIRTGWPGQDENIPCRVEPVRELTEGLYDKTRIRNEIYPRLLATDQLTMGSIVGAWGSLYRREFLIGNALAFYEDIKYSEDILFSANVVRNADSFFFIDVPGVYHYYYNNRSISKSFRKDRWSSCQSLIRYSERDFRSVQEYDFTRQLVYFRWFCILLAMNERKYIRDIDEKKNYCRMIAQDQIVRETPFRSWWFHVPMNQKLRMILIKAGMTDLMVDYENSNR